MLRNVILAIILVIQLAAWFILDPPWRTEQAKSEVIETKSLADLPLDQVARIECTDASGQTLTLVKTDDQWTVEQLHGFPAIQDKVERALACFEDLSRADFRTSKRILHENFDVDEAKGQRVGLYAADGSVVAKVIVGKRDIQGNMGTFIRFEGQDDVFVARSQELATAFSTDPYGWIKREVFDVDVAKRDELLDLRAECYRLEIEGQQQVRDENMRPKNPPEFRYVRYVYERVDPADPEDGEVYWKVLEPTGKEELQLQDLQVKNMVQSLLSIQARYIIGKGVKPEYGLDDDGRQLRVVARFRDADGVETSRVLEIGAEWEPPLLNGRKQANQRYARVSHPGDRSAQSFVFSVYSTYPNLFLREPDTMVRRAVPSPVTPPK